jgi:cytoskeletal protein CcmA (bactofilin family)
MIAMAQQTQALISRGMVVLGDIVFDGFLTIDGKVYGNVTNSDGANGHVAVLANGVVNGNVRVSSATINGCVNGSVHTTERTSISTGARVTGDVRYCVVEVQFGARVEGRFLREDLEPSGKVVILKSASPAAD